MIYFIGIKDEDEFLVYAGLIMNSNNKTEACFRRVSKSDIGSTIEGVFFTTIEIAQKTIESLKGIELKNFQCQKNNYEIINIQHLVS